MSNVNAVMSNLYGAGSSQNLYTVSLTGGAAPKRNNVPEVKYLDVEAPTRVTQDYNSSSYTMLGGGKRKQASDDQFPVYANGTHVPDKTFELMRNTFCLNWYLCSSRFNAIWVVEPDAVVKKFCDEFLDELKKQGITPGTTEASKYAAKNNGRYNKDIFDVYTQNPPNNAGMDYHVDQDFPKVSMKDTILRRTNRDGQVCYFKFISADEILCSDSQKFTDGEEHTTKLKLLAKCQQSVFILKGALPKSVIEANSSGKSAAASSVVYDMTGGGKYSPKNDFIKEFTHCGHDLETASYNFIGKQVLKAIDNGKSFDEAINKFAKHYTGDHVFTAFKLMAEDSAELAPLTGMDDVDAEEIDDVHKELIDKMQCMKEVNADAVRNSCMKINKMHSKALASKTPSKDFVRYVRQIYNNVSDYKADAAVPYVKKHASVEGINNAFKIFSAIDNALSDDKPSGFAISFNGNVAINDIIRNSIAENITSINVKCHVPSLLLSSRRKTRHIIKHKAQTSLQGGSIYGGDGEEPVVAPKPEPVPETTQIPRKPVAEPEPAPEVENKLQALRKAQDATIVSSDDEEDVDTNDSSDEDDEILARFAQFDQ